MADEIIKCQFKEDGILLSGSPIKINEGINFIPNSDL
jgi:hypothetical protein